MRCAARTRTSLPWAKKLRLLPARMAQVNGHHARSFASAAACYNNRSYRLTHAPKPVPVRFQAALCHAGSVPQAFANRSAHKPEAQPAVKARAPPKAPPPPPAPPPRATKPAPLPPAPPAKPKQAPPPPPKAAPPPPVLAKVGSGCTVSTPHLPASPALVRSFPVLLASHVDCPFA